MKNISDLHLVAFSAFVGVLGTVVGLLFLGLVYEVMR